MSEKKLMNMVPVELIESYVDANKLDYESFSELLMELSEMISEMGPAYCCLKTTKTKKSLCLAPIRV